MKPNWFVAMPVPEASIYHSKRGIPECVRVFHPVDMHMTLSFFGRLDGNQQQRICELMDTIEFRSFEITLASLIALPSPRSFSAISWTLNAGKDLAAQLITRSRGVFVEAIGKQNDRHDVLPHITVARPERRAGGIQRRRILEWTQSVKPPERAIKLKSIALYTWSDDRKSHQFKVVKLIEAASDDL